MAAFEESEGMFEDEEEFGDADFEEFSDGFDESDAFGTSDGFDEDGLCSYEGKQFYTVLAEEDVLEDCKKKIQEIQEICAIPASYAAVLLREMKWNSENVINRVLENPEGTLKKYGLAGKEKGGGGGGAGGGKCLICWEEAEESFGLGCGHCYCVQCWREYLEFSVKDGPGCVNTHCMAPDCTELVTDEIFKKNVSKETYSRYMYFFYRSFVEKNENLKWCPAPSCTNAIHVEKKDVVATCRCGFSFCFRCADYDIGDHMPASCEEVKSWMEKAVDESENVKWMMVNTKKCPQCATPIEKNGGCMHMTCGKNVGGCGYEFCWLCRGAWKEHGTETGGYYSCNRFLKARNKEEEDNIASTKTELERYMFHFHRYDSHRSARKIANQQLEEAEKKGQEMQETFTVRPADTAFLIDVTKQLLKNRRALEFSYIYGYYFNKGEKERELFLYLQEDLEKHTNKLSGLYETPIGMIGDYPSFCSWKEQVSNYTHVNKKFLDNFVEGVCDGLMKTAD